MPTRRRLSRTSFSAGPAIAVVLYLLMYAVYAGREPSALSLVGLTNLLNNTVVLALAASGLTVVVLAGELDLSGVGVVAICNVVVATTSTAPLGPVGSLIAVMAIGMLVGLVNGTLVAAFGLQSLAATIGIMIACRGVALLVLNAPGGEVADAIASGLTADLLGAVPVAAVILTALCGAWWLLTRTRTGIAIYAVGADEVAAGLSGLGVRRTKMAAFILAGLCYALAGYMLSAQTGTGDPRASDSFLLYMFASVAIGGTSLMGGRGGVIGSVIGAGILTVMQKMLFALGVAEFYTNVFNGVIMLLAILFGSLSAVVSRTIGRRTA